MAKEKTSALHENKGVSQPKDTNTRAIKNIRTKRNTKLNTKALVASILKSDTVALSRAITLIESNHPSHIKQANAIIKACLPYANQSIRIGVTGVPGVGKSTFIEAFGKYLTSKGKRVAVLAIDPSSSLSKGSILGDKTRMEALVKDEHAFIRPSSSGDSLGGVARKTRESIILCEAAGFDVIIIETVGVGQSETTVHSMVDFFLLLKLAGAGDELQGIKRGIMEMADAVVINKADGDTLKHAQLAKVEFNKALQLYPIKASRWKPKVMLCSALQNEGIDSVWKLISDYIAITSKNHYFEKKRQEQNKFWLIQTIETQLKSHFFNRPDIKKELEQQLELIKANETTPFAAADYLLNL
ncbi:methylmalonyl Co-A mutase-associated GTPase MeaB [Snuella sedimenti]|uniref:Methylmalonyl Co-A mutase-associated GTPase MeaB n=1 Tax=Snuella sedimenti TaxID=2798802 RepID=A0A8J7LT43_9FLAO|nr:methylmalonyl Co-A mutase-associated GTPase MeaB [Snuella sedimenti]MBJ6367881.1 methylmalonyl Co-A mutase-associated GTPase MeaB [Snuella sedimenti]